MLKNLLFILPIIFISSCFDGKTKHGYMFEAEKLQYLRKNISSKDEVFYIMGSPTIKNEAFDNSWVYLAQDVKNFLFFKPKITNREILVVKFDESNIIKDLKKLSLLDENQISLSHKFTEVKGHKEPGFFKAIFSNIGQVTPN